MRKLFLLGLLTLALPARAADVQLATTDDAIFVHDCRAMSRIVFEGASTLASSGHYTTHEIQERARNVLNGTTDFFLSRLWEGDAAEMIKHHESELLADLERTDDIHTVRRHWIFLHLCEDGSP